MTCSESSLNDQRGREAWKRKSTLRGQDGGRGHRDSGERRQREESSRRSICGRAVEMDCASRSLELCSFPCRLEMQDRADEGVKMALRTEKGKEVV